MTQDGLAALTPLQAELLLADQRLARPTAAATRPHCRSARRRLTAQPWRRCRTRDPASRRRPVHRRWPPGRPATSNCAFATDSNKQVPDIVVGPADTDATQATGLVQLPTGSGALIASRLSPSNPGTTVYLVTDTGLRYPVAGQKTLDQLG